MLDHLGGRNRTETQGLFETKASRLADEETGGEEIASPGRVNQLRNGRCGHLISIEVFD